MQTDGEGRRVARNTRGFGSIPLLLMLTMALSIPWWLIANTNRSRPVDSVLVARTALISYATSYQDHYGSLSAGPGHLPCPDLDFGTQGNVQSLVSSGPNPPCGSTALSIGYLPRHIQLADERFIFNTDHAAGLWYAVSEKYINNPVNRIINNQSLLADDANTHTVAWVFDLETTRAPRYTENILRLLLSADPVNYAALQHAGVKSFSTIGAKDLYTVTVARVAAWTIAMLNDAAVSRCRFTLAPCLAYKQPFGCNGRLTDTLFQSPALYPWFSRSNGGASCENPLAYDGAVNGDNVLNELQPQHWMLRNNWLSGFSLLVSRHCADALLHQCQFTLDRRHLQLTQKILIRLDPAPVGTE